MQGQLVTLAALPLTRYLLNSILAIESRIPTYPACRYRCPCRYYFISILTYLVLYYLFPTAVIDRYLLVYLPLLSKKVILTPKLINPKADSTKELLEFKL